MFFVKTLTRRFCKPTCKQIYIFPIWLGNVSHCTSYISDIIRWAQISMSFYAPLTSFSFLQSNISHTFVSHVPNSLKKSVQMQWYKELCGWIKDIIKMLRKQREEVEILWSCLTSHTSVEKETRFERNKNVSTISTEEITILRNVEFATS
jgi:hypothetical protein